MSRHETDIGCVFYELVRITNKKSKDIQQLQDKSFLKNSCVSITGSLSYIERFMHVSARQYYKSHKKGYHGFVEILNMFTDFCNNKTLLEHFMILFEKINTGEGVYDEFNIVLFYLTRLSLLFNRIFDIMNDAEGSRHNETLYNEFEHKAVRVNFQHLTKSVITDLHKFVKCINETMQYFDTDAKRFVVLFTIHKNICGADTNHHANHANHNTNHHANHHDNKHHNVPFDFDLTKFGKMFEIDCSFKFSI